MPSSVTPIARAPLPQGAVDVNAQSAARSWPPVPTGPMSDPLPTRPAAPPSPARVVAAALHPPPCLCPRRCRHAARPATVLDAAAAGVGGRRRRGRPPPRGPHGAPPRRAPRLHCRRARRRARRGRPRAHLPPSARGRGAAAGRPPRRVAGRPRRSGGGAARAAAVPPTVPALKAQRSVSVGSCGEGGGLVRWQKRRQVVYLCCFFVWPALKPALGMCCVDTDVASDHVSPGRRPAGRNRRASRTSPWRGGRWAASSARHQQTL